MEKIGFGREGLAPWATLWSNSKGRFYDEPASPTRTPFQRDRDRIIHSTAFRRLKHKTQVFVYHEGDHYRTRLTHSIEVSQIARALARAFRVDEDLAECLALSHDFGHTPFGHAGEDVLDELMADYGGFDHNAQSLRIVTRLERHYAEFDGLNLSWETLEGLVKHNGPLCDSKGRGLDGDVPEAIAKFNQLYDLELDKHSGIEAQCAAIADDIAYNGHDLDDGLRAQLFDLDAIATLPVSGDALRLVREAYPGLDPQRCANEVVRRQITAMVEDVIATAMQNLETLNPKTDRDIRDAGKTIVAFSPEMEDAEKTIKQFLYANMYRAPSVMAVRENAQQVMRDLFNAYFSGNAQMPNAWNLDWSETASALDEAKRARHVCDFLAGMTDKFAIQQHNHLFDETPYLG